MLQRRKCRVNITGRSLVPSTLIWNLLCEKTRWGSWPDRHMDTRADKYPATRVPLQARFRPEPKPTRTCSSGWLSSDTLSSSHAALLKHENTSSGDFQLRLPVCSRRRSTSNTQHLHHDNKALSRNVPHCLVLDGLPYGGALALQLRLAFPHPALKLGPRLIWELQKESEGRSPLLTSVG